MLKRWTIPRLQHPEVNSRRPGRFEVRLRASRKKSVTLYKIFLLCWFRYVGRSMQNSLPAFFFSSLPLFLSALPCRLVYSFLFKSCKSCDTKRSICSAEAIKSDFFSSVVQIKEKACIARPHETSTFGFTAPRLQSVQQRHHDCCRKSQAFFSPSSSRAIQTCKSK